MKILIITHKSDANKQAESLLLEIKNSYLAELIGCLYQKKSKWAEKEIIHIVLTKGRFIRSISGREFEKNRDIDLVFNKDEIEKSALAITS